MRAKALLLLACCALMGGLVQPREVSSMGNVKMTAIQIDDDPHGPVTVQVPPGCEFVGVFGCYQGIKIVMMSPHLMESTQPIDIRVQTEGMSLDLGPEWKRLGACLCTLPNNANCAKVLYWRASLE